MNTKEKNRYSSRGKKIAKPQVFKRFVKGGQRVNTLNSEQKIIPKLFC